jgi:hypothetical protein
MESRLLAEGLRARRNMLRIAHPFAGDRGSNSTSSLFVPLRAPLVAASGLLEVRVWSAAVKRPTKRTSLALRVQKRAALSFRLSRPLSISA